MSAIRYLATAGLLAAIAFLAACNSGPAVGEVSGTVKVDGQTPAAGSSITFIPVDGQSPSAGATLQDGRYSTKVPVGLMKVEIRVPRPQRKEDKAAAGPGPGGDIIEESLPDRFDNKTELTLEVIRGKNQKDWDLPSQ